MTQAPKTFREFVIRFIAYALLVLLGAGLLVERYWISAALVLIAMMIVSGGTQFPHPWNRWVIIVALVVVAFMIAPLSVP